MDINSSKFEYAKNRLINEIRSEIVYVKSEIATGTEEMEFGGRLDSCIGHLVFMRQELVFLGKNEIEKLSIGNRLQFNHYFNQK